MVMVFNAGGFLFVCLLVLLIVVKGTDPPPPGSFHPIPSDDPHLQPSVNFAAAIVNRRSNCYRCQTLVGVANASEKIVTGALYAFSLSLQESDKCLNSGCLINVSSSACPPSPEAKPYWCDAMVLATPWGQPPYVIEELTCRQSDTMTSCGTKTTAP